MLKMFSTSLISPLIFISIFFLDLQLFIANWILSSLIFTPCFLINVFKTMNFLLCCCLRLVAFLAAQRVKRLPAMQETWVRSLGWEDPPGEGNGNPLQYSCLENPTDGGAWRAAVHGVAERRARLKGQQKHRQEAGTALRSIDCAGRQTCLLLSQWLEPNLQWGLTTSEGNCNSGLARSLFSWIINYAQKNPYSPRDM